MAAPFSIVKNIVSHLKTIRPDEVYTTDFGTPSYGIAVASVAFNRTYKADGGGDQIDENVGLQVKLNTEDNVNDAANAFIEGCIGSQITDATIDIKECKLLTRNPVQKEQEEAFYQFLIFRFIGNFK